MSRLCGVHSHFHGKNWPRKWIWALLPKVSPYFQEKGAIMKDVMFVGTSRNDLRKFPQEVRQEAGYQLFRVQYGTVPNDWKPIKTIGKNVKEIRIHVEGEYRIIYVAHFEEAVYVLHAFQKKTQKTPQHDIELARKRFQQIEREKS